MFVHGSRFMAPSVSYLDISPTQGSEGEENEVLSLHQLAGGGAEAQRGGAVSAEAGLCWLSVLGD